MEDNKNTPGINGEEFYVILDKDWHLYYKGKKYVITSPPELIEGGRWQYRIKEYIKSE